MKITKIKEHVSIEMDDGITTYRIYEGMYSTSSKFKMCCDYCAENYNSYHNINHYKSPENSPYRSYKICYVCYNKNLYLKDVDDVLNFIALLKLRCDKD